MTGDTGPSDLIRRLVEQPQLVEDGELLNRILEQFWRSESETQLRSLLSSNDERLVRAGTWLASELGARSMPLVRELAQLLTHASKQVRFFAIDALLSSAGADNGDAIASVIRRMDDSESAVRWKAMDFLCRATRAQLHAALEYVSINDPGSSLTSLLSAIAHEPYPDFDQITRCLRSPDNLDRKFGAVWAARTAHTDRRALEEAARSEDNDVRELARGKLQQLGAIEGGRHRR